MINATAFIHDKALVDKGASIGANTRIWGFTHILSGAYIGADCNICEQVFIENDVIVGDRVTVKCGVQLWDGIRLEDDVFVGPNVTFTNDKFPRSKQYPERFLLTVVKAGASIGGGRLSCLTSRSARGQWLGQGRSLHARCRMTSSWSAIQRGLSAE